MVVWANLDYLKTGLANISKYREEDSKKAETMLVQIEDNKKSTLDKIAALEKFILGVKEATERAATQTKPQSNFEASLNLMEDVRTLVSRTDSLTYKFDALSYDLNLIKSDIIRQQRTSQSYFQKVDQIEKKVDSMNLLVKSTGVNNVSGNFMSASRTMDDLHNRLIHHNDYLQKEGSSSSTQENHPVPLAQPMMTRTSVKDAKNYLMEEEFEKFDRDFEKGHFDGNLSIIQRANGRQ